ncbi:cyclophilin-like fold protein [Flavobacterium branchiarum]|uniref:Cyclophilin-like fold protein n=1 Tax=Flavobacterium branchiarum TaxID=1114870 RepID=A0ABV5FFQ6_9FLAO|nr:cyclophilin-like fold protein [Flavobacterium branchiarum]MDN3673525.1 cyclophilin-like fold protein [Flavobacterium branchiarum]
MKHFFLIIIIVFSFLKVFASCSKEEEKHTTNSINNEVMNSKIRIKIGLKTFSVTLSDNATGVAFKAMLPMKIIMKELNGNEKYFNLSDNLPVNTSNLLNIQNGDLMLYGNNTLVLFYKSFTTSYSYTNLGRIDDTTGLNDALGAGDVEVLFELE